MLVLSRRVGESIIIGKDIIVEIAEVRGNQVRIAVTAPKEIRVDRSEVRERLEASKKADGRG